MNYQEFCDAVALGKSRSDCVPSNIELLISLVGDTAHLPGNIAELGSYKCGASIAMAAAAQYYGDLASVRPKKVFAFDVFGGLPYEENRGFAYFRDADYEEIQRVTAPFENLILVRGKHEDTVPNFQTPLALIFMDSDFYESHLVCLRHLAPQLLPGGVIVFHDWGFEGVQRAIEQTIGKDADFAIFDHIGSAPNMGAIVRKRGR